MAEGPAEGFRLNSMLVLLTVVCLAQTVNSLAPLYAQPAESKIEGSYIVVMQVRGYLNYRKRAHNWMFFVHMPCVVYCYLVFSQTLPVA